MPRLGYLGTVGITLVLTEAANEKYASAQVACAYHCIVCYYPAAVRFNQQNSGLCNTAYMDLRISERVN